MIYEPREDSFLLRKHVEKYAKGIVLDMGTGSGLQAEAASKSADKVYAADINPEVNDRAASGVEFIQSDLFENISMKFDLIIFNPPYLPDDSRVKDIALDGGKHGYEVIERFLDNVNSHLTKDGKILLLFSSLSKKPKIDGFIASNCLSCTQIDEQKLDFEKLYVYLVEKSLLLKRLEDKGVTDVKFLAKGKRGFVFKGIYDGEKISIKTKNPESVADTIDNEIRFLGILNKVGIGPHYLFSGENFFAYRFVAGQRILDYIEKAETEDIKKTLIAVIKQLNKLDDLGINKGEMHHPLKHILVSDRPVLIDFERCRYTEKPQNITQFCQFLGHLADVLQSKGININKEQMINISKEYAKDMKIERLLDEFQ